MVRLRPVVIDHGRVNFDTCFGCLEGTLRLGDPRVDLVLVGTIFSCRRKILNKARALKIQIIA